VKARELLSEISRHAADKKALEMVELDLREMVDYTDYFLICSGTSERQVRAIHDGIIEGLKHERRLLPQRVEGLAEARWVVMDYLEVVVHIFTPQTRAFYRLEALWGEARATGLSPMGVLAAGREGP
jgi:ribosome-associated protein